MNEPATKLVDVALPVPIRQLFTYQLTAGQVPKPGVRVRVPFGRRKLVGLVVRVHNDWPVGVKLKVVIEQLDAAAVVDQSVQDLIAWSAHYYHHPLGEVWHTALPQRVRQGRALEDIDEQTWYSLLTDEADDLLNRAPVQKRVFDLLKSSETGLTTDQLTEQIDHWQAPMKALITKGLMKVSKRPAAQPVQTELAPKKALTDEQLIAATAIIDNLGGFQCGLLNGITGSGKTEVYFAAIDAVLERSGQVLVLFPEIALTTQLVARFQARFGRDVIAFHSGLSDRARYQAWWQARKGKAKLILGTRSAVFTPAPKLALIIIDEEHDGSYKQQEGFRYHARSLAIKRASTAGIEVVLGSATPAIETLYNVQVGKFLQWRLSHRIGSATLPVVEFVNLAQFQETEGVTQPMLSALKTRLQRGEQSIVFINRRGFAPIMYCPACQWKASCSRCDATLTVHRAKNQLQCHHCGARQPMELVCGSCGHDGLVFLGEGTQRLEAYLEEQLPDATIQRFDRDSLRTQASLESALDRVHTGKIDILVGTQLLTKGHDFPNVTLVGVINADQGLHSIDFRAPEQLFQQLMQVAGRAGRAEAAGSVLIQTENPSHVYLAALKSHDYDQFSQQILSERQQAGFPPFTHLALFRAQSPHADKAIDFLRRLAQLGATKNWSRSGVEIFDPTPSPMEKRGGQYRAQLLVRANKRAALHTLLEHWIEAVSQLKTARNVRWSIDIDPQDLY